MKKILSILLIIFMLSASLITIPVNAKIRYDETDNWAFDYPDGWNWTEGTASYATLDDYLNVHYVEYANMDKSQITTLYIFGDKPGARYTIEDLSGLYDFSNLKHLSVMNSNSSIQSALEALDFSKLINLEKLHLDNVDISNLEIGELINLTYLNISWKAPDGTEENDYYKDLDLSKMEKLNHFEYYVQFPSELTNGGLGFMDGIHRAVVPPTGCELNYNMSDTYSWFAMYLKDLVILDISTDKTSYSKYEDVVCSVNWNRDMQSAEYVLCFDSSKLELVDASVDEDYYYLAGDGEISVCWASLDEIDLSGMSFTFTAVAEGDAVFNVVPSEFATSDLDNVFDYATTSYNYTITIDSDYIKDNSSIQNDFINIDGEYFDLISGLTLTNNKVTLQDLLDLDPFDDGITVKAYKNDSTELLTTDGLGSGSIIKLYKGDTLVKTLSVIVFGDVNGDGEITALDALTIIKVRNEKISYDSVSTICHTAGQVFTAHQETHGASAIDALAIIKHLNDKYEIQQSY